MGKMDTTDLSVALRRVIADSGLSWLQVAKRAGLGYAAIHGFVAGTRDLTLSSANKVIDALELRLDLRSAKRTR